MIVQIYAVTSTAEALKMAELGVDQIGFVAGDYGQVFGELTFTEAKAIAETLKGKAVSSALTMSTDVAEILRMATAVQPDIVHISSNTEAIGLKLLTRIRRKLAGQIQLMKAIHINGPESIDLAHRLADVVDILLLDTKVAGMPGVGATGVTHDWNISRQIVNQVQGRAKVILAGGLTPENVEAAIQATQPWGVDSNTGTNLPGDPLTKDLQRVEAFVKRAKTTEN